MQEILSFFNQGWVGSLLGLIGIIVGAAGVFSYKISKSTAKPTYQKLSLRLIGRDEDNLPKEVTVFFKGKEVDRLTKTTLILWNNGTEVLEGKDIIKPDLIQIAFDEGDNILTYSIIKKTKVVNNFELIKNEENPHKLTVNFDYLDPNDGVVLELLHDSNKRYPKITGTVKGLPNCFVDLGSIYSGKQNKHKLRVGAFLFKYSKIPFGVMIFIGFAMAIFGLIPQEARSVIFLNLTGGHESKLINKPMFFLILGFLYALPPVVILWSRRKKYPKQLECNEIEY